MGPNSGRLYGSIEASKTVKISLRQLYHWVDILHVVTPKTQKYGIRQFRRFTIHDLTILGKMRMLLEKGYTLHAAARMIKNNGIEDKFQEVSSEENYSTSNLIAEHNRVVEELRKARQETELILSSITSILIGVNSNNVVTHWNAAAEAIFGITKENMLNKAFDNCEIQWDLPAVLEGVKKCRSTGRPIRINDIRFMRLGIQEGFLGITVIPMKSDAQEKLDLLIFGADITERKKLEQLKDEFVSTVSHELRTPLTVIREGVSQVLDGILGETTEDQKNFLSISLQAIDRLGRIINDLLDISKIEADKLELKLDFINIGQILKDITADLSPFQMRAKDKGLVLKANLPLQRVELYADKDKLTQVFTNLIGNAMKFTEKGSVEISVIDQADEIECHVTDTGRGIAQDDIPNVFGKFQQFGRANGPGEKGTGLGLAISKGLVEMHHGQIWLKSELGKGTTFIFTIPKPKTRQILKGHISKALNRAIEQDTSLTIALFEIENFEEVRTYVGPEKMLSLMEGLEGSIRKSLRHKGDIAVRSQIGILTLLPATSKVDAASAVERIERDYQASLSKMELNMEVKINKKMTVFPDDGRTEEEIIKHLIGD